MKKWVTVAMECANGSVDLVRCDFDEYPANLNSIVVSEYSNIDKLTELMYDGYTINAKWKYRSVVDYECSIKTETYNYIYRKDERGNYAWFCMYDDCPERGWVKL